MAFLDIFKYKTFEHGIHLKDSKDRTCDQAIRRLPFSPILIVPLSQHFGKPAKSIVRKGQEVVRGEVIAQSDGFMSVPIHAPASGKIKEIELFPTARGPKTESIVIETWAGASQRLGQTEANNISQMSREELIQAVQNTGMVGLGGAGFPTHVKLSVPEGYSIDTLVVNGCECEPYLTTDHRLMLEHPQELLQGINMLMKTLGAKQAIIGIEDNKMDAINAIKNQLSGFESIHVKVVKTHYPQGSEKLLIKVLLGREVPSGGFPYQVGVVVQNIATLRQLGVLLPNNQGLIERVITVTGPGVKKPGNYLVPLGTPIRFLLDYVGFSGTANHLILGGPMMGSTVSSLDVPITKPVSGLLVFNEQSVEKETGEIYPCIKCARCVEACPMFLNPSMLGQLAAKREYESMQEDYNLMDCFECGCCSYVCPSNIPLVQYFRISKSVMRERAVSQ
ncbi:MAG: electron transport complex subunit RsxC [gamma proteobacterium symbiont of Taylorina sp.]|nr:electron transport complex subunit RsxC [gamma proteobacterium symbiont of Taylorina sp.]